MSVTIRYANVDGAREFDEVVANDAHVHLEKMSDREFCLIVETRIERVIVNIWTKRARIDASEFSRDRINRRSEAQHRRWNALTATQRQRRKKAR